MKNKLFKREQGFTIIEVLIVLAIAGLILLIVFLAVPALQRNSRNTQRSNDAAQIGGALNECLANRNGQVASCNTVPLLAALGLDTTKLTQLTNVVVPNAAFPGNGVLDTAHVGFGVRCTAAGDATQPSTPRAAVVLFRIEVQGTTNGAPRCVDV